MGGAIQTVAEFAAATGDDPRELVEFFADQEKARLVVNKSALAAGENAPPMERLPLTDEKGNEYGRVVASIPEDMFYHLMNRSDLDKDWTKSADGVREVVKDVLKSNPACRVKTVSGKTMVGWRKESTALTPALSPRRGGSGRRTNLSRANFNGMTPAS
jgi:hypothetical protein